jgi:hypothetical protein
LLAFLLYGSNFFNELSNIIFIICVIEIGLGSFFALGISEVAYASRSGQNPFYGEAIMRDRMKYHSTQIFNGLYLIFSGFILLLLAYYFL